jgi:hypothetical protein
MIIEFRQLFDRNLGHGVVENLHMNFVRRNEITLRTSAQPAAMSAALSFDFISATPQRGRSRRVKAAATQLNLWDMGHPSGFFRSQRVVSEDLAKKQHAPTCYIRQAVPRRWTPKRRRDE